MSLPLDPTPAVRSSRTARRAGFFAGLLALVGCGGGRLESRPVPQVPASVTSGGEPIYVGRVFPLEGAATEPTFVYERRVEAKAGAIVSTHVTRDAAGEIALAESATHSEDYALVEYTMYANQLGQTGSILVQGDQVTFRLVDGASVKSDVETQAGPVVVGPTLVGYIVRHLDALRAGEEFTVRMAVLDRLETIGFDLEAIDAAPGQTKVRMKPSSFFIGLAVDPIDFTFDAATAKLVRLEGRVPPKVLVGDAWKDFDARVEYRFVADEYR